MKVASGNRITTSQVDGFSTRHVKTGKVASALLNRLLSASCYLGLAPLCGKWSSRAGDPAVRHHYTQALSAIFFLVLVFVSACLFEAAECFFVIQFPTLIPSTESRLGALASYLDNIELIALVIVVMLWIGLVALALLGSTWAVPPLKRISFWRWFARISLLLNSIVLVLIPLMFIWTIWASSLTRTSIAGSKVYFLYDEGIGIPRWGYALGLSRIALQAEKNWGKGSTVLDRLNRETLRTALTSGRVVILATHGDSGAAVTYFAPQQVGVWPAETGVLDENGNNRFLKTGLLMPNDKWVSLENVKVNDRLELAYIFACNGGKKATQWREHLAPAEVVCYDRLSTLWDHAIWFAFTGPAKVKALK